MNQGAALSFVKLPYHATGLVSINKILSDYFARRPPFSEKKKSEFPDAIALEALRNQCLDTQISMYVISGDPDMDSACKNAGPLISIELAQLLDILTAQEEKELHDYAMSMFERHAQEISEQIMHNTHIGYWPTDMHEDVEYTYVNSVDILEKNLIEVSKKHAVFDVTAVANISAKVTQHLGLIMGFPRFRELYKHQGNSINAEISLRFNKDDENEFEIERVDVKPAGLFSYPYSEGWTEPA